MPSSLNKGGPKSHSYRVQGTQLPPGLSFADAPDELIGTHLFAAADLSGANSGFYVFVAPVAMMFLGGDVVWGVAGASGTIRVKKILSAATSAPGAAADTNNVDISAAVNLTGTANTSQELTPVFPACFLAKGDKVAIASSAGSGAGLAGARAVLRFAAT